LGGAGGASGNECTLDTDCTACMYPTAPKSSSECYCTTCAGTVLSTVECDANRAAWEFYCSTVKLICPLYLCVIPPTPACINGTCVGVRFQTY
jgi:hypothetical protein